MSLDWCSQSSSSLLHTGAGNTGCPAIAIFILVIRVPMFGVLITRRGVVAGAIAKRAVCGRGRAVSSIVGVASGPFRAIGIDSTCHICQKRSVIRDLLWLQGGDGGSEMALTGSENV
jgi:hypothetical protein